MRACRASQQNVRVYVYVYAWVCLRFVCARVLGVPGEANEEDLQLYVAFQRRNDHLFTPAITWRAHRWREILCACAGVKSRKGAEQRRLTVGGGAGEGGPSLPTRPVIT